MSEFDCDVLIVGGGPAGSTAGAYLAKAGLRAVIAERDRFPRFHIGESMLPNSNAILRETGAWPKVEAAGFVKKWGADFVVANESVRAKRIAFADGFVPGQDYTYQVERSKFDTLLFDHAVSLGCDARQGTKVTDAREIDGGYEATVVNEAGQARPLRCRYLIDASGRERGFAKPLKLEQLEPILEKRVAVFSHFEGVGRDEGREGGNIVIVRNEENWFWLIPLSEHRTSVGVVLTAERMRASGVKPAQLFAREVANSLRVCKLMLNAQPETKFHVTSDYSYRARQFAAERLILAGDAAGFMDPMFSTGVYIALFSAKHAAEAVIDAHRRGHRPLGRLARWRYTRRVGKTISTFEKLVLAFYDNASFSVFMDRNPPWQLARAINSIVAGNSEPPWRVRWRYWLFLAVCWAQKRRKLVPPIVFNDPTTSG